MNFFLFYQQSLGLDISRIRVLIILLKTFSLILNKNKLINLNSHGLGIDLFFAKSSIIFFLFLKFFKKSLFFQCCQFIDLVGIDRLKKTRFRLVYIIKSILYNQYFMCHLFCTERMYLQSFVSLYLALNWSEREVWDLFGIFFIGHLDLRRILTDYGFRGYPLRKDFPLTGFKELVYSDFLKKIKIKPVSLMQEHRNFRRLNPWGPFPPKFLFNYT